MEAVGVKEAMARFESAAKLLPPKASGAPAPKTQEQLLPHPFLSLNMTSRVSLVTTEEGQEDPDNDAWN